MRKLIWMMSVSVDGFMSGLDGDLSWQSIDHEIHAHFNQELATMSAFLDGRVTYELMAEYWPTADQDPTSTPTEVEFAGIWRRMRKIVFSRTLEHADWNTTIVREVVPAEIEALKQGDGGDLVLGGADIAVPFMEHDLIDEYRVYVHPIVLGSGRPMFHPLTKRLELTLNDSRTFSNGVVLLRYDRVR